LHGNALQTKQLVQQIHLWARTTPLVRRELLTKHQIREKEIVMRAKETNQRCEAEPKEAQHDGEL